MSDVSPLPVGPWLRVSAAESCRVSAAGPSAPLRASSTAAEVKGHAFQPHVISIITLWDDPGSGGDLDLTQLKYVRVQTVREEKQRSVSFCSGSVKLRDERRRGGASLQL
ncbi:unnamed protein product [Pleuronectes platessa]|uniref:Uncharacterized protein n=1 Tax=Pleuronectes platessa TaxID=8262 RepID=A0A9N7VAP8_PLEPL|nr:unnamed protein product [Pleuronectes platessa]